MIPEGEKNINYSESLDFCCEIYMVGSKSGVKNMIHMARNFLSRFGRLPATWA